MDIDILKEILLLRRKLSAEEQKKFGITDEVVDSIFTLRQIYGDNLFFWPPHFISILSGGEAYTKPQISTPPTIPLIETQELLVDDNITTEELLVLEEQSIQEAEEVVKAIKASSKRRSIESLTEEEQQQIKEIHSSNMPYIDKFKWMFDKFGIQQRTANYWFSILGLTRKKVVVEPSYIKEAKNKELSSKKVHFFTAAQNATPVHSASFKSMLTYAEVRDADIHILTYRYKNPTSVFQDIAYEHWPTEIIPYLDDTRHRVAENLLVCADIKIQPTNSRPLTGLQAITDGASAIIAHPRMHMICSAVLEGEHKQTLWTTGSISIENYTDTPTGKKGESFHSLGFVIVEIDEDGSDDNFHIRHISICEDGSFQDLNYVVDGDDVRIDGKITTCRMGDIHYNLHDMNKINASMDLCAWLEPEYLILDDVFDGYSGYLNYHEKNDRVSTFHNIQRGNFSIEKEVRGMLQLLNYMAGEVPSAELVIVKSNHDVRLDKYIRTADWRDDPHNALFFNKCLDILLHNPNCKGLIPYFIEEELGERVRCLTLDDSFKPDGSQHATHGHEGKNGGRGSLLQFSGYSSKMTTNHSHTAGRIDRAMSAGTSTHYRVGYNTGCSNWRQADIIGYPNGKRANILFNSKYKFTTLKYPL